MARKTVSKRRTQKKKTAPAGEIAKILTLGISLLLLVGYFFRAQTKLLGEIAYAIMAGVFGEFFGGVAAVALVVVCVVALFERGREYLSRNFYKYVLFVFMICGILAALDVNSDLLQSIAFSDFFKLVYENFAFAGMVGNLFAYALILIAGKVGTVIILVILALVDFVAITNVSVMDLLKKALDKMIEAKNRRKDAEPKQPKEKKEPKLPIEQREPRKPERPVYNFDLSAEDEKKKDRREAIDRINNIEPVEEPKITIGKHENNYVQQKLDSLAPEEQEQLEQEIGEGIAATRVINYIKPPMTLLTPAKKNSTDEATAKQAILKECRKLEETLKSFGVEAKVINVTKGPAVTRYELSPAAGVKVSKIVGLADDIALNLASQEIRIEAPIPGKAAIGIEVPNKDMDAVVLSEIINSKEFSDFDSSLAFAVGKGISGEIVVSDIGKMPHVLIAGATGSGKSVCINSLIMSILYKASPDEVKLLMVDPKVVELGIYNGIPHLMIPVVTDPRKASGALNWAVKEMTDRYNLFAKTGVRDINGYNTLIQNGELEGSKLPNIVIIIDELADLMMVAPGEVEDSICRLAQMARAAGMHLVIATQRPSVDVITGIIKANIPSRIAFAVTSQVDSRTILDMAGAEKLLGKGDMLFSPVGSSKPRRIKGCFVSDQEVENVVEFIKSQGEAQYDEDIMEKINEAEGGAREDSEADEYDELLPKAIELVVDMGQASVSLIQRKFKVGYARAARMIDQLEERGIIGGFEGSKPRQVLISKMEWMEMQARAEMDAASEDDEEN